MGATDWQCTGIYGPSWYVRFRLVDFQIFSSKVGSAFARNSCGQAPAAPKGATVILLRTPSEAEAAVHHAQYMPIEFERLHLRASGNQATAFKGTVFVASREGNVHLVLPPLMSTEERIQWWIKK